MRIPTLSVVCLTKAHCASDSGATVLLVDEPPPQVPGPDDGVIEDARMRQWRHRVAVLTLLAAAAAVVVATGLAGGGGGNPGIGSRSGFGSGGRAPSRAQEAQEARQIARVAASDPVPEAQLFAGGTGWAISHYGLSWTRDDGRSWSLIEPPELRHPSVVDISARIDDVAYRAPSIWVAMGDLIGTRVHDFSYRYATIARTTDDGKTWRSGESSGCDYGCGAQYMSFLTATRGYLLSSLASLARPRLDETNNGGATWTPVGSAPFAGAIQFTTASDGWGVSNPSQWINEDQTPVGGGRVYGTTNGGHTWQRVRLTPPRRYAGMPSTAGPPAFFGAEGGVIPVRYRNRRTGNQYLVVYTTADGGRSWATHLAPPADDLRSDQWGIASGLAFSAPNPRTWLFFAGRTLYETTDTGNSWTTVQVEIPAVTPLLLSFTTPTTGWAIFSVSTGDHSYPPVLVRTTNAGTTWTALAPR